MKRFVTVVALLMLGPQAVAAERATVDLYNKSCVVCHASGAARAPKTGVAADWEPRIAKGDAALLQSVKDGLRAMPPKGMCFDCSDQEFLDLIHYMAVSG